MQFVSIYGNLIISWPASTMLLQRLGKTFLWCSFSSKAIWQCSTVKLCHIDRVDRTNHGQQTQGRRILPAVSFFSQLATELIQECKVKFRLFQSREGFQEQKPTPANCSLQDELSGKWSFKFLKELINSRWLYFVFPPPQFGSKLTSFCFVFSYFTELMKLK